MTPIPRSIWFPCITLMEPWATLLITGQKRIETRSWKTAIRGPIVIHASTRIPSFAYNFVQYDCRDFINRVEESFFRAGVLKEMLVKPHVPVEVRQHWEQALHLGHALGITTLDDCRPTLDLVNQISTKENGFGDYSSGRYGWVTSNPVRFSVPIQRTGRLLVWKCNIPLEAVPDKYQSYIDQHPERLIRPRTNDEETPIQATLELN